MTPQTAATELSTEWKMAVSTTAATIHAQPNPRLLARVVNTITVSTPARRRHFLAGFFLLILFLILTPSTIAQTGGPSPTPSPFTPPSDAGLPSAQMQKLMDLVRELVPYVRRQVERPLMQKFSFLGMILASIILLFSFIRVIRENDGASTELYYWF